jgi:hypothetical protein
METTPGIIVEPLGTTGPTAGPMRPCDRGASRDVYQSVFAPSTQAPCKSGRIVAVFDIFPMEWLAVVMG